MSFPEAGLAIIPTGFTQIASLLVFLDLFIVTCFEKQSMAEIRHFENRWKLITCPSGQEVRSEKGEPRFTGFCRYMQRKSIFNEL